MQWLLGFPRKGNLALMVHWMDGTGCIPHLASRSGRWARDGLHKGRGGCWMLILLFLN
jgi:hypothetical protein